MKYLKEFNEWEDTYSLDNVSERLEIIQEFDNNPKFHIGEITDDNDTLYEDYRYYDIYGGDEVDNYDPESGNTYVTLFFYKENDDLTDKKILIENLTISDERKQELLAEDKSGIIEEFEELKKILGKWL